MKGGETLKNLLVEALSNTDKKKNYKRVDLSVVDISNSTVKVTDDSTHFFVIREMAEEIIELLEGKCNGERIKLNNFCFEIEEDKKSKRKIIDIVAKNLELARGTHKEKLNKLKNIENDSEVKALLGGNRKSVSPKKSPIRSSVSKKPTPSKNTAATSRNTATPSKKPSKAGSDSTKTRSVLQKKTIRTKTPVRDDKTKQVTSNFKRGGKFVLGGDLLSINELIDVNFKTIKKSHNISLEDLFEPSKRSFSLLENTNAFRSPVKSVMRGSTGQNSAKSSVKKSVSKSRSKSMPRTSKPKRSDYHIEGLGKRARIDIEVSLKKTPSLVNIKVGHLRKLKK